MNRRLLGLALCLVLAPCVALAQGQDAFMERYGLARTSLDESVSSLPQDSTKSLDRLEQAAALLRPLSEETTSRTLVGDMENTFERARTAIANGSQTDLAVQVELLEGGFERIAYEAALRVARAGDRDLAQARLATLAADMELPQATLDALGGTPLAQLQLTFERGVASAIGSLVEDAGKLAATDVGGAYVKLATAYGHYIPIQDSPRISPSAGASFVAAIGALVNQQKEGLSGRLDDLIAQAQALHQAVEATFDELGLGEGAAPAPAQVAAQQAPTPETAAAAQEASAAPVSAQPAPAAPVAAAPETPAAVSITPVAVAETAPAAPAVAPPAAEEPEPGPAELKAQALRGQLAGYRLSPAETERLAGVYARNDLASVDAALDGLFATAAKALAMLETGRPSEARGLVSAFRGDYGLFVAPLVARRNASLNQATIAFAEALESAPALRPNDVSALMTQTQAVAAALEGKPPSAMRGLALSVHRAWAGALRLSVMILLGVLAFVPLYLLNLAFGGGNRNWRWIGVALFLLLLPLIYQGLSYLGSLLAGLTGFAALDILSTFSPYQNTISQLVWVVVTVTAIGFAIAGLYGICVQFGLLGRSSNNGGGSDAGTRLTASDTAPGAVVDWDEEF